MTPDRRKTTAGADQTCAACGATSLEPAVKARYIGNAGGEFDMTFAQARTQLYVPPAPPPRIVPPNAKPSLQGYLRYFQIMSRNPLEIWTENHFNDLIHKDRVLGRQYVMAHDPNAIRRYLVTNADNYGLTELRRALFEPVIGNGLLIAEGDLWKRTRRALTPVFTPRHVRSFAPSMVKVATAGAEQLIAASDSVVSFTQEMLSLALKILTACLFSDDARLDVDRFSKNLDRLLHIAGMPHPLDLASAPKWVPRLGRGEALRVVADLRGQVETVAKERRRLIADGADPPADFLTLLLSAGQDEGAPLSEREVTDNLITFLSAGHETTARTLTWIFYLLSNAQETLARAQAEIGAAPLEDTDPADWSECLPFTTALIKESMRLYPAASIFTRLARADDTLADIPIAAGTEIITSPWVLHRHRKLWEQPDAFVPDRFLGDAAETIQRFSYIPFGMGPRVCIGASFSMQEMVIIVAVFLRRLKFEHVGRTPPMPVMRITIQPSTPVYMRVKERDDSH
ncbi:MAG: cytochrome P450 [Pseudomonadota bacterium]